MDNKLTNLDFFGQNIAKNIFKSIGIIKRKKLNVLRVKGERVMYRFRTVDNLIGDFQELEKQQIYFAHPEQLNDPMEGMRRYYWQGDEIIWRNLLKHFIPTWYNES